MSDRVLEEQYCTQRRTKEPKFLFKDPQKRWVQTTTSGGLETGRFPLAQ